MTWHKEAASSSRFPSKGGNCCQPPVGSQSPLFTNDFLEKNKQRIHFCAFPKKKKGLKERPDVELIWNVEMKILSLISIRCHSQSQPRLDSNKSEKKLCEMESVGPIFNLQSKKAECSITFSFQGADRQRSIYRANNMLPSLCTSLYNMRSGRKCNIY